MTIIACHDCDLLQREIPLPPGRVARCVRCGAKQYRVENRSIDHTLALTLTAAVVGRWSMLDIYVVAILAALVQIGALATINAGPGALAFGAVVVLTMYAAMEFDPRLIWDPIPKERFDRE